jgi:CO/xanthine dehydrogenase Mo-binding subunit
VGGLDRVTGRQAYVADIPLDDVLHVKLVTLPVARARIGAIDDAAACAVPGVRLVMSARDLPDPMPRFGPQRRDRPVIATGETKYHGDPVAAVAAETKDGAEEAARLVQVAYDELPAVHTLAAALAADAPLVQDPALRPDDPHANSNVLHEHRHSWGDLDAAAADPDLVVVEGTYEFPMVTQFAIEPHAFMAAPDGDGIAIWSAIQHPNWLQRVIAELLRLPLAKVRVHAPDPGGAFGGKQHAKYEPLLAFMALATGRPVRLVLTLEETFQAVRRGAARVHVRTGFQRDGTLAFRDVEANYQIGAYADIADRTVAKGSYTSMGPYLTPSARIVARSVLSHTVPSTAFRGFGNPQQIWAVESNMNEAARALDMDPLELRLKNLAKPGDAFIPGDTPADGDWAVTVRRAAEMIEWSTPPAPGRGRGIAVGLKSGPTTGLSYSTVRLLVDGSVVVYAGTSDMGQGARTIFAQIAADELGAPLEWVTVVSGDTAVVPYDQQTSASRSSVFMGNAVLRACRDIQAKVRSMAARLEGVDEAAVTVERGEVRIGDRTLPIQDLVTRGLGRLGGEIIGIGEMRKDAEPDHPLGGTAAFYEFNCTAVELEVDRETGDISIARYVTVSDVGKALNPLQVRGQDEGAAVMGLGHTLMEHYIWTTRAGSVTSARSTTGSRPRWTCPG